MAPTLWVFWRDRSAARLFGHFGDRLGRKSMLVLTMFIMGLSTFCIGLLPNYASIGVLAPILLILLRIVQGIGLGGEWGGASLMVIEHSPADKRGFYGSFVQIGFPIGLVLASLVFALATKLPEADFQSWGWRIPFLASIVLLALGTFIRSRVPETPVFERMKATDSFSNNPVGEVVGKNFKTFLIAVGLKLSEVSWVYMLTVFVVVYATTKLTLPEAIAARRRDVCGAVRTDHVADVRLAVGQDRPAAPSSYWARSSPSPSPSRCSGCWRPRASRMVTMAIIIAMNFGHGMMFGLESTYFPELFGPRVRYSGASFGFQVAAAIGGGFSPIIATALVGYFGGTAGVSIMMIGIALITLWAALAARETKDEALDRLTQDRFIMRFGIFIYDGVEPIDLATFGVLSMARRIAPQIEICTIAPKPGIVRLSNGLDVIAQFGIEDAPACDIVIVTGGPGWEDQSRSSATLAYIQTRPRIRARSHRCVRAP